MNKTREDAIVARAAQLYREHEDTRTPLRKVADAVRLHVGYALYRIKRCL